MLFIDNEVLRLEGGIYSELSSSDSDVLTEYSESERQGASSLSDKAPSESDSLSEDSA